MSQTPQNYDNHARVVPGYHMVTFALLVALLIWALWRLAVEPTIDRVMLLVLVVALILTAFYARVFALTVQDRVIRLEMRLRCAALLPADLQPRVEELTPRQFVALRFAGDHELADLVRRVLDEKIGDPRAIKKLVRHWRADDLRA